MYGLLQAFAKWLEGTPWGVGVRTSLWAYPFTQLVHFTGLSIWLGTNLALDLRLLGLGKTPRNGRATSGRFVRLELDRVLHCRARRFSSVFLDRDDVSGQRRVSLEAGRFCSVALLWHIFVQWKARDWGATQDTPAIAKFSGLAEILLWICVITAAVEIPNH